MELWRRDWETDCSFRLTTFVDCVNVNPSRVFWKISNHGNHNNSEAHDAQNLWWIHWLFSPVLLKNQSLFEKFSVLNLQETWAFQNLPCKLVNGSFLNGEHTSRTNILILDYEFKNRQGWKNLMYMFLKMNNSWTSLDLYLKYVQEILKLTASRFLLCKDDSSISSKTTTPSSNWNYLERVALSSFSKQASIIWRSNWLSTTFHVVSCLSCFVVLVFFHTASTFFLRKKLIFSHQLSNSVVKIRRISKIGKCSSSCQLFLVNYCLW